MLKSVAGRLLALKILAVTAGAAAAGGVAYAATTGDLAAPHGQSALHANAHSSGAPESDDESSPTEGDDSSTAGSPSETGSSSESDESGSSAAPSPSLVGLCHAWLAHPSNNAKLSTNPAYSVLVTAAGGVDAVNGYCTTLLASAHPSHPARPSHPTQAKNSSHSHPAHPTAPPVSTPAHATGKPSVIPSHSHPAGRVSN